MPVGVCGRISGVPAKFSQLSRRTLFLLHVYTDFLRPIDLRICLAPLPQHQNTVSLQFKDGTLDLAAAFGTNAGWNCRCDRTLPLLGRSDPSEAGVVVCRDCGRRYRVLPESQSLTRMVEVVEMPSC